MAIKSIPELTDADWLQIEQAAYGCVSGTSDEWPALARAIGKIRGKPLVHRQSASWLRGFCQGVIEIRDAFAAINGGWEQRSFEGGSCEQ